MKSVARRVLTALGSAFGFWCLFSFGGKHWTSDSALIVISIAIFVLLVWVYPDILVTSSPRRGALRGTRWSGSSVLTSAARLLGTGLTEERSGALAGTLLGHTVRIGFRGGSTIV